VAVETRRGCRKTLFQKIRENNFASRFDLSDVFEFQDILHPPILGCLARRESFSTATGHFTQIPIRSGSVRNFPFG
jgi:hypothetical protein